MRLTSRLLPRTLTIVVLLFLAVSAPATGEEGAPDVAEESVSEPVQPGDGSDAVVLGPATLADAPLYRLAGEGRLERSENGGAHWFELRGLPTRALPEERAGEPLPVTAFTMDPADPRRLLVAVGRRLFASSSSGASWDEVVLDGAVNRSTYITALAMDPEDPGRWAAGTSYDGIHLTEDGGETWIDVTSEWDAGSIYLGAGFYEEVSALEFRTDGSVVATLGYGNGFVRLDPERERVVRLRPTVAGPNSYDFPSGHEGLATDGVAIAAAASGAGGENLGAGVANPGRGGAANRTGIYVSAANATPDKLPGYFDLIRTRGYNSMVVDLKDDFGRVTYDTRLELPREVGAVQPLVDVPALVEMARENDVYLIARIVLFKDPRLFQYDNNRYALWDSNRDRPWGVFRTVEDEETGESRVVQVEHWVDPFSPDVRRYNIDIAREAESLGVDEIQFDYVRFPSDGNTEFVVSRFEPEGADRVQALEAFLSEARRQLSIPIGIDVFGFNGWSRMSYLGQDISRLGRYVDVISPMFYPSHFAIDFLPDLTYFERAAVIYDTGTRRARAIAGGHALIRPYIQAFLIGRELEFETETYFRYLELQVEGAAAADSSGYTLWNASGRYYMLR